MKRILIITSLIVLFPFLALSQSDKGIRSDRPFNSLSAYVLPQGLFQIETGFSQFRNEYEPFSRFDQRTFRDENTGFHTSLFRYGVSRRTELRLANGYSQSTHYREGILVSETSSFVTSLGLKTRMSRLKNVSILSNLGIANETNSTNIAFLNAAVLYDGRLFKSISFRFNLGAELSSQGYLGTQVYYGFAISRSLIKDRLSIFLEPHGYLRSLVGEGIHNINGGLLYAINESWQIDLALGSGFSRRSPDIIFNVGISKVFLKDR